MEGRITKELYKITKFSVQAFNVDINFTGCLQTINLKVLCAHPHRLALRQGVVHVRMALLLILTF